MSIPDQSKYIHKVEHNGLLLALILRTEFNKEGIEFFTPSNFSQQLGYMNRPAGYIIAPHTHNSVPREVDFTKEVLFVKSGKMRVDFYDTNQNYLESQTLIKGDVILLAYGGHGFEMIDSTELIEVKQGPYAGDRDKTRFEGIESEQINRN
tara:strand:+ start:56 stop:508 length:453 start_codon:yes stop_codon:yes gene_type:complete